MGDRDMTRPKRDGDWVPLTARLDANAGRRLRVAAAKRGTTQGRILDELIFANLPPVDLELPNRKHSGEQEISADWLRQEMGRIGLTQAALAAAFGITPKSVSEWFERGHVPPQRIEGVRKALAAARKRHK